MACCLISYKPVTESAMLLFQINLGVSVAVKYHSHIFVFKNAFEGNVSLISAILTRPQWFKGDICLSGISDGYQDTDKSSLGNRYQTFAMHSRWHFNSLRHIIEWNNVITVLFRLQWPNSMPMRYLLIHPYRHWTLNTITLVSLGNNLSPVRLIAVR